MWGQWNPFRLTAEGRSSPVAASVILALYVAGTLFVGLHHEPWRDEADSWLVVRDASIPTILSWTRNAGTPALWYLTLKPLVWAGLPYQSQQILHLLLAWAAAALLVFRAPFNWITKILILGSYYFAYEYAIIARSYVLTVLLLFLIAAWYPWRYERRMRYAIAIALLFNANVHGAVIAGILTLLYVLSIGVRRVPPFPVAVMVTGALAAWAQLRTASDAAFPNVVRFIRSWTPMQAIDTAFFPGPWLRTTGTVSIVILALVAWSLRKRVDALLFLFLSIGALCAIYALVWFGGYRHAGLILLVVIVAMWMAREVRVDPLTVTAALLLNLTLLLSGSFGFLMARADVKMAFSGSREMGEFIRANQLDRYEIAAHNVQQCEAVLPWVPGKRVWYPALGRSGTYMLWNNEEERGIRVPHSVAVQLAVAKFAPSGKPWLMLLNMPMPGDIPGFRLIYNTRRPVFRHGDERYWLYEWRAGVPPAAGERLAPPAIVAGRDARQLRPGRPLSR